MTISTAFKKLGAPLNNPRWSWGALRKDGTVVLRVWAETVFKIEEKNYVQVLGPDWQQIDENGLRISHGLDERKSHVALLEAGAKSILVMCHCNDHTKPNGWTIKSFDSKTVFIGGQVIHRTGLANKYITDSEGVFVALASRVPFTKGPT